jgi:hypothetical protein
MVLQMEQTSARAMPMAGRAGSRMKLSGAPPVGAGRIVPAAPVLGFKSVISVLPADNSAYAVAGEAASAASLPFLPASLPGVAR